MRPSPRTALSALLATALAGGVLAAAPATAASDPTRGKQARSPVTFALLGDTPYGDAQRVQFPALLDDVNRDSKVRMVLHAGDVKSGSQTCSDARFLDLAQLYGQFEDPFVLTPGDNDWTDCHRTNNGAYLPTERLDRIREIFYPDPEGTLGQRSLRVQTQAADPEHAAYVENAIFERNRVVFASVHVVGSSNGLAPWTGLPGGDQPAARTAEFQAREAAALDWIDAAFDRAEARQAEGVLLLLQAEPVAGDPGFTAVRERILARSAAFDGKVLLTHGDEHRFEAEPAYGGVANLTRLETYGDTATQWLKVTVDPRSEAVFSWESQTVGS